VLEVARRMQEEGVRHIVVASAGSDLIAGVISELDLLRAVLEGKTEGMASDVMTLEPPPSVRTTDSLDAVVDRMRQQSVPVFIVVDGEPARPVGVLAAGDVAAYLARR
jgi:CBS domain-containing protein